METVLELLGREYLMGMALEDQLVLVGRDLRERVLE